MKFKIRNIEPSDIENLAHVFVASFKPENTGEYWNAESAKSLMQYWFQRSPKDLKILAVDDHSKISGCFFADVKPWWDGMRMIDGEFFVCPENQGEGIGTFLLMEMLTRAKSIYNATYYEAITFEPLDKPPFTWYEKKGFKKSDDLLVMGGSIDHVIEKIKVQTFFPQKI